MVFESPELMCMPYLVVRSKVIPYSSEYLQNPENFSSAGDSDCLKLFYTSPTDSGLSGNYSASFCCADELITPSDLGERSIFVLGFLSPKQIYFGEQQRGTTKILMKIIEKWLQNFSNDV